MKKNELIDKLVQNDNSAFLEDDIEQLKSLSTDMLKRICLSVMKATGEGTVKQEPASVENSQIDAKVADEILTTREALKSVQQQIYELRAAEAKILDELYRLGSNEQSIFNADKVAISEDDIATFVKNSKSEIAEVLREALELRNRGREDLIVQVITNSGGLFSKEDLRHKTSEELKKLAALSGGGIQNYSQSMGGAHLDYDGTGSAVANWEGAGIGNVPIRNEVGGGEPLGLMSTF